MRQFSRSAVMLIIAMLVLGASPMARADQVDNPRFKAWANYKVGSNRTLSGSMQAGQMQFQVTMLSTLKEVTDDHVTVATQVTTSFNGQSRQAPEKDEVENAKIDQKDYTDDGEENVDAMGKTFKCKVYEATNSAMAGSGAGSGPGGQSKGQAKVWACDDVPGGIVKIEIKAQGPQGQPLDIVYLVSAYEAK